VLTIACFCGQTWRTESAAERCPRCAEPATTTTHADSAAVNASIGRDESAEKASKFD